jgi:DNA-binding transcriptional regulator YiaG
MNEQLCPVCAMGELQQEKKVLKISKYGLSESRDVEVSYCPVCEAESYLHEEDESVRRDMVNSLEQRNVRIVLEKMAQKKVNFASLERTLSLPQRTLSKWKQGAIKPSEAGIVLVNLLSIMPWLSRVVDNGYDPQLALSLQWESFCKSIEPVATDALDSGYETVIGSYVLEATHTMEPDWLPTEVDADESAWL